MVFHGVAGGCTTAGDADLAINRGQVRVDRAGTDDEAFSHLRVRQSFGYQTQHLDFTGAHPSSVKSGLKPGISSYLMEVTKKMNALPNSGSSNLTFPRFGRVPKAEVYSSKSGKDHHGKSPT